MPRKSTKKRTQLAFPLLDEINNFRLNTGLLEKDEAYHFTIGDYITDNMVHKLRPYQAHALFNLNYTQTRKYQPNHQFLFNMATGSGKTDVMAASMLYLYAERGYQEFLFVSNTNTIVKKTRENFINTTSNKFLFQSLIEIDGERIEIKEVDRYPANPRKGEIYVKLTTIQSLSNELGAYRENGLTFDDLSNHKLVILADEAHHFNVTTRTSAKGKENQSWEDLLDRIRTANEANLQLEFTATIDVDKKAIYEKYRDKIVYRYNLNEFMQDGYSKRVMRLQSGSNGNAENDREKMINVVLLSQFRKHVAKSAGIENFKPVIMFKANKVAFSKEARDEFLELIANLDVETLRDFLVSHLKTTKSRTLTRVYTYWMGQDLADVISELKKEFTPLSTLHANDTAREGLLGNNFDKLNSLEDEDNPIRTVFAVAKLTEGWDVLNLYDIVRIGEQSITATQTNAEAQLVGRGARYNPFKYQGAKSYQRRFDNVPEDDDKQYLEVLHYHTINDNKYIDNLVKSMDKLNLITENDSEEYATFTATLKSNFRNSKAYNYGNLYQNRVEEVSQEAFSRLGGYGFSKHEIVYDIINSTVEQDYQSNERTEEVEVSRVTIANFATGEGQRLLKTAMARNPFFRYAKMKPYMPMLKSLDEFRTSDKWLGDVVVKADVATANKDNLTPWRKLALVDKLLAQVKTKIKGNYCKQRGTKDFEPVPIKEAVADYTKRVALHKTGNAVNIDAHDMKSKQWFVYDYAIVDDLENSLIRLISNFVDKLEAKYDEVYLIRNEETVNKLKLHEFSANVDVMHYEGFMPDFLLYLGNEEYTYQIYIEPKGDQLLVRDAWKEQLLQALNDEEINIIGEDQNVRLYGVKFYTYATSGEVQKEIEQIALNGGSEDGND